MKFLKEMSLVAEAVYRAFKPNKLNYELLGNFNNHLHWHIIPRYNNDPSPKRPIWVIDKNITTNEKTKPSLKKLAELKQKLVKEISKLQFY